MRGARSLLLAGVAGKLVGVFRELLLAALYGTSGPVAAYRVAQTATLIPINFFTADALSAGFLPNETRMLRANEAQAAAFYIVVNRLILGISVVLTLGLLVARDLWVRVLAPGLDQSITTLAASMLVAMALGVPFYLSTAMGSYLEMAHGRFALASARASVQSVGLIVGTVAAYVLDRPTLLAWGFTLAYAVLAIWTRIRLRAIGLPVPQRPGEYPGLLREFWISIRPILLVPIALQGSFAVERSVASLISSDTVAALDYARLVTETAMALVAAPLGLAVLANIGAMTAADTTSLVEDLLRRCLLIFVPISVALVTLASPVTQLVFVRGAFDAESSKTTASILTGLAFGLWAQVTSYVMVKALSGRHRNGLAAICVGAGSLVMIGSDLMLYRSLGPLALGLGASLGAATQFCLASAFHRIPGTALRELWRFTPPLSCPILARSPIAHLVGEELVGGVGNRRLLYDADGGLARVEPSEPK